MFAKIKSLIEYCGLSYKFEIFKIVFINILGIVSSVICYLFLDEFLYLILGIIVTLICDYFLLSSYSSKKSKLDEERENEFVKVISKNEGKMRTWERGAGVTLACGTGATSTAISGYKLGLFDSNILLHLPGGDLKFNVYEKDDALGAFMEGPAELVYDGEF